VVRRFVFSTLTYIFFGRQVTFDDRETACIGHREAGVVRFSQRTVGRVLERGQRLGAGFHGGMVVKTLSERKENCRGGPRGE